MKLIIYFLLFVFSTNSYAWWFGHDNYWECLLEKLDDVQNDTVAQEAIDSCKNIYPFYERTFVEKKSSWFGIKTADECAIKYGKRVESEIAARYIQSACYKLYPGE